MEIIQFFCAQVTQINAIQESIKVVNQIKEIFKADFNFHVVP